MRRGKLPLSYTGHAPRTGYDVGRSTSTKKHGAHLGAKEDLTVLERGNAVVSSIQPSDVLRYCLSHRDSGDSIHGKRNGLCAREFTLSPGRNIRYLANLAPGRSRVVCHICLRVGALARRHGGVKDGPEGYWRAIVTGWVARVRDAELPRHFAV